MKSNEVTYCQRYKGFPSHHRAGPAGQPCTDGISVDEKAFSSLIHTFMYNNGKGVDCTSDLSENSPILWPIKPLERLQLTHCSAAIAAQLRRCVRAPTKLL